jgi:hypothetical protein
MKTPRLWAWVLPLVAMFLLQPISSIVYAAGCGAEAVWAQWCEHDNDWDDPRAGIIIQVMAQCIPGDRWVSTDELEVGSCDLTTFHGKSLSLGSCACDEDYIPFVE